MEKHWKHGKSDFELDEYDYHPGCMAGMLHVLDYRLWGPMHRRRKHSICWRKPRTYSMDNEIHEKQSFLDSEGREFQVGLHFSKLIPKKGSMMAQTAQERSTGETKMKNKIKRDFSHEQIKEYVDVLEILDVNKDISTKILKDPNLGFVKRFHVKKTPNRLIKSGSFPLPGSSRVRPVRSMSLEHKQKEHWSFPKEQNLVLTVNFPHFDSSEFQKDFYGGTSESLDRKTSIFSHDSSGGAEHHGLNHMVMNGFRDIKKRIKHALEDRKKKKKQATGSIKGIDSSDLVLTQKVSHPRKSARSLNNSLDRYSQLFEQSFRREVKFDSKSLNLRNENDKGASKGKHPKFFRRVSSLSGLESISSFLSELSRESLDLEIRRSVDAEEDEQVNAAKRAECQEKVLEGMESRASVEISDQESSCTYPNREAPQQSLVSVPQTCSSDNMVRKAESLVSEASDTNSGEIHIHVLESSLESQNTFSNDDLEDLSTRKKQENFEHGICFEFVKNVLEVSGFLGDKDLGEKWHSEDQLLNPELQDELDDDDQILFGLINETLAEMCERSCIFHRRPFLSTRLICRMPKGKHLLDEVWGRIRWNIVGSAANLDCSLDDLVAHDLANGVDGWMNIEPEAEGLSLELEDMIFHQLLDDELICL